MTWAHAPKVPGTPAPKGVQPRPGCRLAFSSGSISPCRTTLFCSPRRLWPRPRICPDDAERAEGPVDRRDVRPGPDPHLLQSGGVLVRFWDGFDVVDNNPEFGSGVSRHVCPPGLQWVSGRVALSERSQRRRVICEASPSGHATERTTSPPPARYRAGDGDAVNTDSQDAVGRAWSSDRSSVAVGNCGAS